MAALLAPTLIAGESRWSGYLLTTAAVLVGCLVGPAVAVLQGNLNGRLFTAFVAVVAPLVIALGGLTALLVFIRLPIPVVTTVVTVLALAWLTWPIWLSPWLAGNESLVSVLSPSHPLLVIDAAISREGGTPWVEQRIMYGRLTVLGQHVFPRPPTGVGEAALFHGVVGLVAFLPVVCIQLWNFRRARRARPDWDEFEAV
ncbi:hypothetical protein [Humisphaera borealis]|uniref:Uncharacterized protein n=1 Tax=Humisphaera borealis TaxID=2807512 RepID=A0A7M2WQH0_9BACT|nr:hypothetical protein [Humisphaera borealis]QOV87785.1 hypothetical protein IPV69_16005 [Humisphaera borealis]